MAPKFLLPASAGILTLLHLSGIELLPAPCVITLCVTQFFTVLNHLAARPTSKADKVTASSFHFGDFVREVSSHCGPRAQYAAAFAMVVVLARVLRLAGVFSSPLQIALTACLCGGIASCGYVVFLLVGRTQTAAVDPRLPPRCNCWHKQEDTCKAGLCCPYHPEFWPAEQEQEEEEVEEIEESPMASLLATLLNMEEMPAGADLSEESSLEQLAEKECLMLLSKVNGFACEA